MNSKNLTLKVPYIKSKSKVALFDRIHSMYIGLHEYGLYIYIIYRGASPSLTTTTNTRYTIWAGGDYVFADVLCRFLTEGCLL